MSTESEHRIPTWLLVPFLMVTMVWVLFAVGIGGYFVEEKSPTAFVYAYVLRDGAQVTRDDAPRPLYDLVLPPQQSGRPAEFVPTGRFRPNLGTHEGPMQIHKFSDGTTLVLSGHLTAQDQAFLKDAFQRQRGARFWQWLLLVAGWIAFVVVPPLLLFGLIWISSRFKFAE